MSTSDDTTWSFSRTFTSQFQASRNALESRIAAASSKSSSSPEPIQELSISLANLTKTLAGATGSLPSYDQKQYELQLKELERSIEALRVSNVPKSKFAFKRKPAAAAAFTNAEPSSTQSLPPPSQTQNAPPPSSAASTHLSLFSHSHRYLTREDLPSHPAQSDLSISDLDHCIVNLLPSASPSGSGIDTPLIISALHARNLSDCVLLLPDVDGSALIHDLERCVVALGCHQFRMHASSKVDVYLSITSNPIIEHCKEIRFSSYPTALAPSSVLEKDPASFSVQDFSHIRATPSPNYVMKDGADADVGQWPLATVSGEELERALVRIIPRSSDQDQ